MKFVYQPGTKEFSVELAAIEKAMARAATAAVREAGTTAVRRGRAHIGAAGFRDGYFPWQSGWQMQIFPATTDSLRATVRLSHKVGIASVFEHETVVTPRGRLMWLPLLRNLPAGWKRGGVRSGPKNFRGKLASVNRPGRAPLLVGRPSGSRKSVPLFVGIKQAQMPKRFDLYKIIADAAESLAALYNKHMKAR